MYLVGVKVGFDDHREAKNAAPGLERAKTFWTLRWHLLQKPTKVSGVPMAAPARSPLPPLRQDRNARAAQDRS